jgi:PPM family protein phosphatase
MPKIECAGISDTGLKREHNEDRWLLPEGLPVALLADGVGGSDCGEVAAELCLNVIAKHLAATSIHEISIKEAIREGNRQVREYAREHPGCANMTTTLVLVSWAEDGRVTVANVGDSRAYRLRNQQFEQLSYDQSLVNELRHQLGFTDEQVANFANKNVLTMAVGSNEEVLIRHMETDFLPGDQILLCSDGLHGPVNDPGIVAILLSGKPVAEVLRDLIAASHANGAPDNVTAMLVQYREA